MVGWDGKPLDPTPEPDAVESFRGRDEGPPLYIRRPVLTVVGVILLSAWVAFIVIILIRR